ncbi:hypothetical protein AA0N74_14950, partial [Chromobacterium vaccinii]
MNLDSLLSSFASAFNQDQRLLTLELGSGQVAAEQLLPQSLDGEEGVSKAYRYQLTCLSPDGAIELKTLLGQSARIGIRAVDVAFDEVDQHFLADARDELVAPAG